MKCYDCGKEITTCYRMRPGGSDSEMADFCPSCYRTRKPLPKGRSYEVVIEDDVGTICTHPECLAPPEATVTISNIAEGCGQTKCFTCGKEITGEGHHYNRGLMFIDQPPVYVCDECFGVFSGKLTCDGCRKEITTYSVWDDADGHRHRLCSSCYKAKRRIYNALSGQKGFTMNLYKYVVVELKDGKRTKILFESDIILAKDPNDVRVKAGIAIKEGNLDDIGEIEVVVIGPFGG